MQEFKPAKWPTIVAGLTGVLSALLGLTVLVGWHTHNTAVLQIHPSFVAMVYNTALGFFLCGLGLLAISFGRPLLATVGGIYVTVIGLLTFGEIMFDKDFGIDQFFMWHYGHDVLVANPYPGRMALNTSVFWPVVGVAMLLISLSRPFRLRPLMVGLLGSITFAQGLVAFSGYLTGTTTTYAWGNLTRMAVHTACGFAVLGAGLLGLAWRDHSQTGIKEVPRWLPIVVGVAISALTVSLWQALVIDQRAQTEGTVAARTSLVRNEIAVHIDTHIKALERMARRWHLTGMRDQQQRQADATMMVADYKGLDGIRWIDPSHRIDWTIPLQGHEDETGMNLALDERSRAALDAARATARVAVSRPIQLASGGMGFLVVVPLYEANSLVGYIDGFFSIQHLMDTALTQEVTNGYCVVLFEGEDEIYRRGDASEPQGSEWKVDQQLELPDMNWRVEVWPATNGVAQLESSVPTLTLLFGLLISFLLGWTVWLSQSARERSKIAEATGKRLEQEVVERTHAQQALAGALEKEQVLFNNTLDVLCSVNADGVFVTVSPSCLKLWGYQQEELIGRHYIDLVAAEDVEKTNDVAARIINGESTTDFVNCYLHKDGSYVHTMWSSSWSESQQLMFAVARDITERRLVETALQESEQKFRSVTHSANDAIIASDSNGMIISWNHVASAIFGYSEEEILGKPLTLLIPDVHRETEARGLTRDYTTGEAQTMGRTLQLGGLRKNGAEFPLEISIASWTNGGDRFHSGIIRDITERKQVALALEQARDAALESVRLKSEFLANMSHEIRTPMNGVIGMAGLLLRTPLSVPQREYAGTIQSSADALLRIIDDILDFSKIEAGLLHFESIAFDLRGAVEATVDLLAERAQVKGLELASLVYSDVPTSLRGDPGRLRQVLTNLAGNALKFTDRGEVIVSVKTVGETESSSMLRFEIRDTGIGISAEAQPRLFSAFTQADGSMTRRYGGTGLGLAISKQLVELMGGQIGIESRSGHGSTFWFTAEFEKQNEPATTAGETSGSLSAKRVLIVDDNATNRSILNHQTSSWGMIPTQAESGERALELLRAGARQGQPFDIAILDLMMTGMDGFQLAEAIKADPLISAVAVVLLPSFGDSHHGERARQVGIAAILRKPVRQSKLYACLTAVIGRSEGITTVTPATLVTADSISEGEVHKDNETFSKLRIIVADDNTVNQRVALAQLHDLGHSAEAVSNGLELLQVLENAEYDLILMDCQMPEMDGFAATAEIRRREGDTRHTVIVAMTANALDGDAEKCLAAGMDDYLSKPVKQDVLRRTLERWPRPVAESRAGERVDDVSPPARRGNVIDLVQLASLRLIRRPGKGDFVTELIDLFVDESISQLEALHEAASRNDATEIRRLAHYLRGSCVNIGAEQMAALYEQLERDGADKGNALALLMSLEKEFQLVHEALKAERRPGAPTQ